MKLGELFSECIEHQPGAVELPKLPSSGAVYLLTDEHDQMVQLASAADLRRAVHNRLKPPESPPASQSLDLNVDSSQAAVVPATPSAPSRRRADLSHIVRRIWWQPVHSVFEATFEYHRLARLLLPDTYLKNVAFGPAWFVHVEPAAAIPRFWVSKLIQPAPVVTLGPMATQQDANRFVQVLEDAFDLCRYVNILEQAPHGQPCAYHEMGRCPAPCGGLIPMSQYRETIVSALRYATGDREQIRTAWQQQMNEAAGRLEFEKAAGIKQRIQRAADLDHVAYRFVRPMEQFSWLIVQRGGGRTRVKPFFVRGGWLQAGETAKLKDLESAVPEWIAALQAQAVVDPSPTALQLLSEHVWLVSHFLWKNGARIAGPEVREDKNRTPGGGLFADATRLSDFATLTTMISERFAKPEPAADESR